MTEQPPTPATGPDDATTDPDAALPDDDELDDPWHDQIVETGETFGATDVVSVVAFVLAVASICGFGLVQGATYIVPFLDRMSEDGNKTALVLGPIVGAGLALVPVWLGWLASARSLPDDPRWVVALARSAVLLGLLSGLLHLLVAVFMAAQEGPTGLSSI
jgi:hypothetical protein